VFSLFSVFPFLFFLFWTSPSTLEKNNSQFRIRKTFCGEMDQNFKTVNIRGEKNITESRTKKMGHGKKW